MSRSTNSYIFVKCLHLFFISAVLFGAFSLIAEHAAQAAKPIEPSELLQLTSAGHVLGFDAEGVYVATGDHMLRVEFAGASAVAPVADGVPENSAQPPFRDRVHGVFLDKKIPVTSQTM